MSKRVCRYDRSMSGGQSPAGRRQSPDREPEDRDRARSRSMDTDNAKNSNAAAHRDEQRSSREVKENQQENNNLGPDRRKVRIPKSAVMRFELVCYCCARVRL